MHCYHTSEFLKMLVIRFTFSLYFVHILLSYINAENAHDKYKGVSAITKQTKSKNN